MRGYVGEGTLPSVIAGNALRQVMQLHRARLAMDAGESLDQAIGGFRPMLHFKRKPQVEAALRNWTSAGSKSRWRNLPMSRSKAAGGRRLADAVVGTRAACNRAGGAPARLESVPTAIGAPMRLDLHQSSHAFARMHPSTDERAPAAFPRRNAPIAASQCGSRSLFPESRCMRNFARSNARHVGEVMTKSVAVKLD